MEEEGLVIAVNDPGRARIRMIRSAMCDGCGAKSICHPMDGAGEMIVEAEDPLGVSVGQRVRLTLPAATVLKASFAVYILPLVAMIFFGAVAGRVLEGWFSPRGVQLATAIAALLGLAASYVALRRYMKRKPDAEYRPVVTAILQ
jgi:sigma-E factor negative regulatory protein RseC